MQEVIGFLQTEDWPLCAVSFGLESVTAPVRAVLLARLHRLAKHPVGGPALAFVCSLAGFAVVARFSYQWVDTKSGLEALWLPNGVVVALFVLVPRKWRPWVLLGVLPGELIADTLQGYPLLVACAFSLTDMFESALAGLILLRIAGRRPRGDRQRDFYAILLAAAIAPIPGGLIGGAIETINWGIPYQSSFLLWWFGDLTGIFLVVSVAISLASPNRPTTRLRKLSSLVEAGLVVAVTCAVFDLTTRPIMFVLLFPVVGVALRHSLRVTALASLAFAMCATFLTATGHGPFTPFSDAPTRVMLVQGFITVTAAIAFLISATMSSQRRAERDLARSLAVAEVANVRVRASFEGAAIGMMLIDAVGVVLAANQSSAAMFGCSAADLVGIQGADLIHPDDLALLLASRERRLREPTGHTELELRNVRKDGTVMIGRYTISPIHAEDGSLLHQLAEIEDVTELRRVEAELVKSRALEQAVVEVSGDVLAVVELDGTIRLVSRAVEDQLGYTVEDLVGSNFLTFIHPDDRPAFRDMISAELKGEKTPRVRCRVLTKDGRVRLWDGSVSAEPCTDRPASFLVANLRDMTDEVEREERLRQTQKLETVGRLAGGVAHDFNNLLVGILGYNELALAKIGDGPGAAEISGALAAAKDAAALTAQLLAHSRRQVLDPQVFDLRDAATEMTELLRRMIDGRIEIVATLPENEVLIKADRPQIGQVIMNLAVNASDAMPSGGRLTIEVAADTARQRAVLTVEDEGTGMDAETAAQIYEPFFSTKGDLGTGLGLSTVHGIVVQSGGQISVESIPGHGTTFTVLLPLATGDRTDTVTGPAPARAIDGGEQILFVDDDSTVRDVVSAMLSQRGYNVSVAASGAEAVALSQTPALGTVDLILTDLAMTGLNGRQTAEAIRMHQPTAKTLYISGYTEDEAIRVGGYEPGVGFLQKPFSTDELDAKIRVLIDAIVL
jgi:two-component system, cell cycle sensor histidine kinase and response regulator CckA